MIPFSHPEVHQEQELTATYFIFFKQQVSKPYAMHMPQWFSSRKVKCQKNIISKDKQIVFKGPGSPQCAPSHFLPHTEAPLGLPSEDIQFIDWQKTALWKNASIFCNPREVNYLIDVHQVLQTLWTGAGEERQLQPNAQASYKNLSCNSR